MLPKSSIETKLDEEINALLDKLKETTKGSEEYENLVDRMVKLHKLKSEEKTQLPSLDTALFVATNIFGILWITRFEREHVINTKALGFVLKPR